MPRLRFYDLRNSRLPTVVGLCIADSAGLASYINAAQQRLMFCPEGGDESWYGTWAEVAFNVSRDEPYLTLPRSIARMEMAVVCDQPIALNNQFYEYLQFGNGRLPKQFRNLHPNTCITGGYRRNSVPTMADLPATSYLKAYLTDEADLNTRILFQGVDQNGNTIQGMDGAERVSGIFVNPSTTGEQTAELFSRITGIQKDQTVGNVQVFAVDPDTAEETLLVTMEPSESVASYQRYYFDNLPLSCCPGPVTEAQQIPIIALCKLEPLPVNSDTEYLVIQNLQAMIEECQSLRYMEMDSLEAKQLAIASHKMAVNYLNGELTHYYGKTKPAVLFKPFGSADLRKQSIGTMI